MERVILHSDMNCFYASVEMKLDSSLKGKAIAVCGSASDRHGICLAKSELAKKAGVKTGMAIWEAKKLCPELIIVPPQYDQYVKYSNLARKIYERYTDRIEPYGLDECWLDLTGCLGVSDGINTADEIRTAIRDELGITASIGISFNKVFAKLGSDMKKPDAQTYIGKSDFKKTVWPLPVYELLYVGRATAKKLYSYNIRTIGDLALSSPEFLQKLLGINGVTIWQYANGLDNSRVMHMEYHAPVKSVGHGITTVTDLMSDDEVWLVMLSLAQDIGHKLKKHGFKAEGVQIDIRDNKLQHHQFQTQLKTPSQSAFELSKTGFGLFKSNYKWDNNIRSVTIRAINLIDASLPSQISIYDDVVNIIKKEALDNAVDKIRCKFGRKSILPASLMQDLKIPDDNRHLVTLPGLMHQ